jgi:hypothetical protein
MRCIASLQRSVIASLAVTKRALCPLRSIETAFSLERLGKKSHAENLEKLGIDS